MVGQVEGIPSLFDSISGDDCAVLAEPRSLCRAGHSERYRLPYELGVFGSQVHVWFGLASLPQVGS